MEFSILNIKWMLEMQLIRLININMIFILFTGLFVFKKSVQLLWEISHKLKPLYKKMHKIYFIMSILKLMEANLKLF